MEAKSREARRTSLTSREISRRGEIVRLMRRLEWDGYPRLQMFILVTLTGVSGLAASYVLLRSGVDSMFARYPLAVGCAYLVFLFLLWLWLRTKAEDYGSVDIPLPSGSQGTSSTRIARDPPFSGGGGESGGGGASSTLAGKRRASHGSSICRHRSNFGRDRLRLPGLCAPGTYIE